MCIGSKTAPMPRPAPGAEAPGATVVPIDMKSPSASPEPRPDPDTGDPSNSGVPAEESPGMIPPRPLNADQIAARVGSNEADADLALLSQRKPELKQPTLTPGDYSQGYDPARHARQDRANNPDRWKEFDEQKLALDAYNSAFDRYQEVMGKARELSPREQAYADRVRKKLQDPDYRDRVLGRNSDLWDPRINPNDTVEPLGEDAPDMNPEALNNPIRRRESEKAFIETFGRSPSTKADWTTAYALNPNSHTPATKGVAPKIIVTGIRPVPGQGVVRASHFIKERDVSNPSSKNAVARNKGDDRGADPLFDPEGARVVTYVDYENGIVIVRQNPSVVQEADGTAGDVETGDPSATVVRAVRISYEAHDPIGLGGTQLAGKAGAKVNGDIVITPSAEGVVIGGTRSDYPWFEAYQTRNGKANRTIVVDPPRGFGTG